MRCACAAADRRFSRMPQHTAMIATSFLLRARSTISLRISSFISSSSDCSPSVRLGFASNLATILGRIMLAGVERSSSSTRPASRVKKTSCLPKMYSCGSAVVP